MIEIPLKQGIAYKGKFLELRSDQVQLPNGQTSVREYITHPGSVAAVPLLDNGNIILVRQFRYPVGESILEIPAGKLEAGERPESAICRELTEEIGYFPDELLHLTTFWTSPGFCNEVLHLYLAKNLTVCSQPGDSDEFIETIQISKDEIRKIIQSGKIVDGKTLLAVSYLDMKNLW